MLTILHGENAVQSRARLVVLMDDAKKRGWSVTRVDAKSLELPQLEQLLSEVSLFGQDRLLIFEELHSLPKSKRKEQLIARIAQATDEVVLWEKRPLTPTMLKAFPSTASATEFKTSNAVFSWLDSLDGSREAARQKKMILGLRKAIDQDGDFMCHAMLARQLRMLIEMKERGTLKGAPFMIAKLKKQAESFSLPQLLAMHHQLLELDIHQKTSSSLLGLGRELELFILKM